MRKIIAIIVALLGVVFYATSVKYNLIGVNANDGRVFTNNDIQTYLYSSQDTPNVSTFFVNGGEGIYRRGTSIYYGDNEKVKVDLTYPLYLKDGEAIKLLNGNESLIDSDFVTSSAYANLIIDNGLAFNDDYERADFNEYILVRLVNSLYVNVQNMKVETIANEYEIGYNSIMYITPDSLKFYSLNGDTFVGGSITDVDEDTIITIGDTSFKYGDLLTKLGEVVIHDRPEYEEPQKNPTQGENTSGSNVVSGEGSGEGVATGETATGGGNGDKLPQKNESVEKPKENPPAEEPEHIESKPEDSNEENDYVVKYPNWQIPTVKTKDVYKQGVYSIFTTVDIDDPAKVIVGGITYEVIVNEGTSAGAVYKRVAITTTNGEDIPVLISGLKPDSKYILRAYYKYYDKYGRDKTTVQLIDSYGFQTKEVGDLGYLIFNDFKTDRLYGNKIQIKGIQYSLDSDMDAIGAVEKVEVRVTSNGNGVLAETFNSKTLAQLQALQETAYTSTSTLNSDTTYNVEFVCFDRYGNKIRTKNASLSVRTCKNMPGVKFSIEYPKDEQGNAILSTADFKVELTNVDNVPYSNLRLKITDSEGNIFRVNNSEYVSLTDGVAARVFGLPQDSIFSATVLCEADNGDGLGNVTRTLTSKQFSTMPLSQLGSLNLKVRNVTSSLYPEDTYRRAVLEVSVNEDTTKLQLLQYVDNLTFTLKYESDTIVYSLNQTELNSLKNNETIYLDTDQPYFALNGLKGNKTYQLSSSSYYLSDDEMIKIPVNLSLGQVKTDRTPVIVSVKHRQAISGYIGADISITDVDDVVVGDSVILRVYETIGSRKSVFGSFRIDKNGLKDEYGNIIRDEQGIPVDYKLRMYNDANYSSDNKSYNVKGNTTYTFEFLAEEANTSTGLKYDYVLSSTEFSTEQTLEGDIYLLELNSNVNTYRGLPEEYTQVEYLKSTGTQYIVIPHKHNETTWFDMDVSFNRLYNWNTIIGSGTSDNAADTMTLGCGNNGMLNNDFGTINQYNSPIFVADQRYNIIWNFNNEIIDGVNYTFNTGRPNTTIYDTGIFIRNLRNSFNNEKGEAAFYKLEIYSGTFNDKGNSRLEFDLVPARRNSDGELGLYDMVSGVFYTNAGTGSFITGREISESESVQINPDTQYNASLAVKVDDQNESLENKTVYIDVYNNNALIDTINLQYVGTGTSDTPLNVNYPVYKDTDTTKNSYYFELYTYYGSNEQRIKVPLSNISFTTEQPIYTISNIDEFIAIKSKANKYVVVNDIYYDADYVGYTGGPWGGSYFNAKVDFQGFTFEYSGYSNLLYYISNKAEISNMVFKSHAKLRKNTNLAYTGNDNRSAGSLAYYNYGTLKNIFVEYSQDQPGEYKSINYWQEEQDGPQYAYFNNNGLIVDNHGLIENFIVKTTSDLNVAGWFGTITAHNFVDGTIRNGYVYGNDEEKDYKVQMYLRGSSANYYTGVLCGRNENGVIENVYVLADVYNKIGVDWKQTAIITGENNGSIRNTFVYGNVSRDGVSYPSYGPSMGNTTTSTRRNYNNFYISDLSYSNVNNSQTSVMALRNTSWMNSVLNATSNNFNVNELIKGTSYPQLIYSSNIMPAQELIPLPPVPNNGELDLLYSGLYEPGLDEAVDERILPYYVNIGDEKWITPVEGFSSDIQIVVAQLSNKTGASIWGLKTSDGMQARTLLQVNNGLGITTLYLQVYNPTLALRKYRVSSVIFEDPYGNAGEIRELASNDRYLNVTYYNQLTSITGDQSNSWTYVQSHVTENYRLKNDLDFSGRLIENIFVPGTFTGIIDGENENGDNYKIKNVSLQEGAFNNLFASNTISTYTGIFNIFKGDITNITFDNVAIEGGVYSGIISGFGSNCYVDNVFVNNSYVSGVNKVGGLFGHLESSDIKNAGVTNTKVVMVGGFQANVYRDWFNGAGGLIGVAYTDVSLERTFASEIYVECMGGSQSYAATGGLIGALGDKIVINGSYATGYINSATLSSGGLIGAAAYTPVTIYSSYADVDIVTYGKYAGGLVGSTTQNFTTDTLLSFGDVSTGNITSDDVSELNKNNAFSLVSYNSNRFKGLYFEGAKLTVGGVNKVSSGNSFSADLIRNESLYSYLNRDRFVVDENAANGVLPKMTYSDGNIMPYQKDVYIDVDGDSDITISNFTHTGSTITITINHPNDIYINGANFDYLFLNNIGVDTSVKGINSLLKHKALNTDISITRSTGSTIITANVSSVASYYDTYRLVSLSYTKNGEINSIRTTKQLKYQKMYQTISNIDDWKSKVAGTIAENFIISGDIDFSGLPLNYCDEKYSNLVINRLEGNKGNSDNYDDMNSDADAKPYWIIKNAEMANYDSFDQKFGRIYNYSAGFIRNLLTEASNLTFENINITRNGSTGIFAHTVGRLDGIIFKNCDITNPSTINTYGIGLVGYMSGSIENAYFTGNNIDAKTRYSGSIGSFNDTVYGQYVKNIYVKETNVKANVDYSGILFGNLCADYPLDIAVRDFDNITVIDSTLNSTSTRTGSVVGYVHGNARFKFNNVNAGNNVINASYSAGGLIGENQCWYSYMYNCYVYNSKIKSTGNYAGGVTGVYNAHYHNVEVDRCTIIALGSYAGGLSGYHNRYENTNSLNTHLSTDSFVNDELGYSGIVVDSKIYSKYYAGGIGGIVSTDASDYIIKNCEIKTNSYGGGLSGSPNKGSLNYCYVTATIITPWESSSESLKYGIIYDSNHVYFGGLTGIMSRATNCLIENSFIGGSEANYVGGFAGNCGVSDKWPFLDNSVENCVVVGKEYVGGMFGTMLVPADGYASEVFNCYSNASVYGESYVAGIAGLVSDFEYSAGYYTSTPLIENCYFTGSISSKNDASTLFGQLKLSNANRHFMTDSLFMRNISSMPSYIKGSTVYPLFNTTGNEKNYNLSSLKQDKSDILISLYADTKIITSNSSTTMENLLMQMQLSEYLENTGDITVQLNNVETVVSNYTAGIADDKFIILYKTSADIVKYFDRYSTVKGLVSQKSLLSDSRRYGYRDILDDNLMPLFYAINTRSIAEANLSENNLCFRNLTYNTPKNPFDNNSYESISNVNQGVAIPGTELWTDEFNQKESLYNAYMTGGTESLPIGPENEIDVELFGYTQLEYLKSTGTQYIVIPHKHNETTWFDMDVSFNRLFWNTIIGSGAYDNSPDTMTLGIGGNGQLNNDFGKGLQNGSAGIVADKRYNIIWNFNNEIIDGVNYTFNGIPNSTIYDTGIFIRNMNNSFTSERGEAAFYKLKIYSGTFNDKANSTLEFDLVPARRNSDGELGLYDMVSGEFYTNRGTGTFLAGEPVTGDNGIFNNKNFDRLVSVYCSDVDKFNIELSHEFYSVTNGVGELKITSLDGNTVYYSNNSLSTVGSVLTFKYNYKNSFKVELNYTLNGQQVSYTRAFDPSDVYSQLSLWSDSNSENIVYNHALALVNGSLYDENGKYTTDASTVFVNLFRKSLLDSNGNIYTISYENDGTSNELTELKVRNTGNNINLAAESILAVQGNAKELYRFNYKDNTINTFATKSVISGNGSLNLSKDYRLFVMGNNITAIMQNANPVADPLYGRYNDKENIVLMLKQNGIVYSIGTKDILSKLNNFQNSGIRQISSNYDSGTINSTNPYILFAYNDKVVGYNLDTYQRISFGPSTSGYSLGSYLTSSLSNMFSLRSVRGNFSTYSAGSSSVANVLTANDVTLDTLVDFINRSDTNEEAAISAINEGGGIVEELNNPIYHETEDIETEIRDDDTEGSGEIHVPSISTDKDPVNAIDKPVEGGNNTIVVDNTDKIEMPNILGIDRDSISNEPADSKPGLITDVSNQSEKTEYVSVFNGETEEFEIYSVDELLSKPDEAVSQDKRVVDKATLKALYSSLAQQEDKTNERGIMLYLIIAAFTLLLLISVILLVMNSNKRGHRRS